MSTWIEDDGGRAEAGYKGSAGDCTIRALAIAMGHPYQAVYEDLNELAQDERPRGGRKRSSSRTGVALRTTRRYLESYGWHWTPTMGIGTGCRVHLRADELPPGRLIVRLSGHLAAVINGIVHDTSDPSREGTRCVYGYWSR
jgi:hypothetical protein